MSKNWLWCGYPHHFIGGDKCAFSLATWVADGRWLVSTIGDYRPHGTAVSLGADGDDMFETMVFECDPGERVDGEPTVAWWGHHGCWRYATAQSAVEGHMLACEMFDTRDENGMFLTKKEFTNG